MKITVEVDCTPDEARQFLGLPDVKPLQAAALARLEQQMAEAASVLSPDVLLRSWLAFVPQSPEQFRDSIAALFRPAAPAKAGAPAAGSERTHR